MISLVDSNDEILPIPLLDLIIPINDGKELILTLLKALP